MLLQTPLQQFQFIDKYAKFNHELGRRETWAEMTERVTAFLRELSDDKLSEHTYQEIYDFIYSGDGMPSMRLVAMAGPAARREHNVLYNCAYLPIDSIESWVEMMHIAMGGTGIGYSVESQYVDLLPTVKPRNVTLLPMHVVQDSSQGWARALELGLNAWFGGEEIVFDYSQVRPQGAPLKTKGGRASGPEPLRKLLDFARDIILARQGEKLTTLDCHDITTMLADCVVQGAVRRSALICLFDQDDQDMLTCKDPGNIEGNYHRFNANNSVVWTRDMEHGEIRVQMESMHDGKNGEPGIFSRLGATSHVPDRRSKDHVFGTNPCGEIILRPRQFCNLTTAVARNGDQLHDLVRKVRIATIIGTIQSSATHFPDLPEIWKKNCEEERLLGVDINGQMDCSLFHQGSITDVLLRHLREVAVWTNQVFAEKLGINESAAVTCVKPSGNSSALLDCAPGLHPRYSAHYKRRVRVATASSMYWMLKMQNYPMTPENFQEDMEDPTMWVAEFYIEAPEGAIVIGDRGAIEQLDYWLSLKRNYTEHNPSCTITYQEDELPDIIDWLFENQKDANGVSFLPASDIMYKQAPYEAISGHEYTLLESARPRIDWSYINVVDGGMDNTTAAQELACVAGGCDI